MSEDIVATCASDVSAETYRAARDDVPWLLEQLAEADAKNASTAIKLATYEGEIERLAIEVRDLRAKREQDTVLIGLQRQQLREIENTINGAISRYETVARNQRPIERDESTAILGTLRELRTDLGFEPSPISAETAPPVVDVHQPARGLPVEQPAITPPKPIKGATQMPHKNPAFVQANVRRAREAWNELAPRITDPADRERLRLMKLAIFDLDEWQTELAELLSDVLRQCDFHRPEARAFHDYAQRKLGEIERKGEPA